jgi:alpha-D-ribose 1-methylphosphonate 5-triphosphate synthase subunit PhnL
VPHSNTTILTVNNLSKRFTLHETQTNFAAFDDISLTVRAGAFTGLVGASGAGKSSILKCIYRRYLPTSGEVLFTSSTGEIVDLAQASDQKILELRRREIRFVSQFLHTLPRQTAREVVAAPLIEMSEMSEISERRESVETATKQATEALSRIGLPQRLWDLPPSTFSGGERQLVNLARALIVRPRLLLLDEPTASLDPTSTSKMVAEIERLKADGVALMGVFHDRRLMDALADDKLPLSGGVTWEE